MNEDLCIVLNTHSNNCDIWDMFFRQLKKHFKNTPKLYMFTNSVKKEIPDYANIIKYNDSDSFTKQYLHCIKQIKEKYCLYMNDDYILYNNVDINTIEKYIKILELDNNIQYIRLLKGIDNINKNYKNYKDLFIIPAKDNHSYTQQPTIWVKRTLEKIHELGKELSIGIMGDKLGHFEADGSRVCEELDITGLYYYNGEHMRGLYHYDSIIFPFIASALIKGKWNFKEYNEELIPLIFEYNIDPNIRGIF